MCKITLWCNTWEFIHSTISLRMESRSFVEADLLFFVYNTTYADDWRAPILSVWQKRLAQKHFEQLVCLGFCESYTRQVIGTGGRTTPCFGAASCQHGDLGAEVVAAADGWVLIFGVGAHVPLQVPPPPLPFDLSLHLQANTAVKNVIMQ